MNIQPLTICFAQLSYTCSCVVFGGRTRSKMYGLPWNEKQDQIGHKKQIFNKCSSYCWHVFRLKNPTIYEQFLHDCQWSIPAHSCFPLFSWNIIDVSTQIWPEPSPVFYKNTLYRGLNGNSRFHDWEESSEIPLHILQAWQNSKRLDIWLDK